MNNLVFTQTEWIFLGMTGVFLLILIIGIIRIGSIKKKVNLLREDIGLMNKHLVRVATKQNALAEALGYEEQIPTDEPMLAYKRIDKRRKL